MKDKYKSYSAGRLNALRMGPGLLDSLYDAWVSANRKLDRLLGKDFPKDSNEIISPKIQNQVLPHYILFVSEDIIGISNDKREFLIKPFCELNNIESSQLFISVLPKNYIGLRQDVFNKILEHAVDALVTKPIGSSAHSYAYDLLLHFEFLPNCPAFKKITIYPQCIEAPYKIPTPNDF